MNKFRWIYIHIWHFIQLSVGRTLGALNQKYSWSSWSPPSYHQRLDIFNIKKRNTVSIFIYLSQSIDKRHWPQFCRTFKRRVSGSFLSVYWRILLVVFRIINDYLFYFKYLYKGNRSLFRSLLIYVYFCFYNNFSATRKKHRTLRLQIRINKILSAKTR